MKNKITYEQMFDFITVAQTWLMKDEGNASTKMGYAVSKVFTRLKKPQQKWQNRREEIQIDACLTDEKGRIVKNDRGEYEYTKEGMKERNSKWQELWESEFEFEPYFATDIPLDLSFAERETFNGFVLTDKPEDAIDEDPLAEQPSVS